ncbi:MAG TPA: metallophosphoesterase [Euryarchaeota archaeon]|nr:phosphodiesterase [archaeon BMS3Bbin15]HDL15150.1 metallophosphoesterase [Euryarchaeota archaeon]
MKKIGILSDSHDNMKLLKKAVEKLNKVEIELVLHAGDIVAPFSARLLGELKAPVRFVFGNNDGERQLLRKVVGELNSEIDDFLEIEFSGKNIALYHGTDRRILDLIVESQRYFLVATGHTHEKYIKKVGNTLVVNPGELCGYLTGEATFAVLDLEEGEVQFELLK